MKVRIKFLLAAVLSMLLFFPAVGMATSAFFDPMPGYAANDVLTSFYFSGYDVSSSNVHGWANGSLKVIDKTTGAYTDLGTAAGETGWNSFVRLDPSGSSVWAGFTGGTLGDRIYQVDFATRTWTHKATMANNFDMEFYGNGPYVSGLNDPNWNIPNSIWLLDTSGADNHDKIVEMSGNSAGLAFDSSGNAYYASNDQKLFRWDADDILEAIGTGYLSYADGTKLSDLELGAYDTDVDDAGNIIFNGNGSYSYTSVWNGTAGDGYNYDYVGVGDPSETFYNWFTFIDSEGDITEVGGGALYQTDYPAYGIAEVNAVPIPGAVWLLGSGLLCLVGIRRRIS